MLQITVIALFAVAVFPLLLECTKKCEMVNQTVTDYVEGHCPMKLTPVVVRDPRETYSECATVHVWMKDHDICKAPRIEILSPFKEIIWPIVKKRKKKHKCIKETHPAHNRVLCVTRQDLHHSSSFVLWEFKYDCIKAEANRVVSVSYGTTSTKCTVSYKVPDPVPKFDLSMNRSSKSINVTVQLGEKVYTRWCYKRNAWGECMGGTPSPQITIDPSRSRSAVLHVPYLLPCVCVQVYYTFRDAQRELKCPFQKENLTDVADVWRSSEVTLYESVLTWSSVCPASNMNISAALCWKQRDHVCVPVLNSTLTQKDDGSKLIFDTSAVDKHPHMCVQFSLQGSHNISCPFQADMSSWEVDIGLSKKSVSVYLTSVVPSVLSSQLCVVSEEGCSPIGLVHTLRMDGKTAEIKIKVPPDSLFQKPCVQVWQSAPALSGKRILCPDYTHNRFGMFASVALILVLVFVSLGMFLYRLTRTGAAGWLYVQKPVLLVCSSEQSAHVSAACALASLLQGELNATVHTALWAQASQKRTGTGVADLGPLPWLYGQWETVRRAEGKVLIIWSHEAKTSYDKWKEKQNTDEQEKCKKERRAREECVKLCDKTDWHQQREPSAVIAPMFAGALSCLQGALQQSRGQGVVIVYFQGLGHSRDIPKAFRDVPRYCLPQDFRGLIQELGGIKRRMDTEGEVKMHCWPRLLAKAQSVWLARQLAHRLQTLLPQTAHGKKTQRRRVTSSQKKISDKKQRRPKLSLAANEASPQAAHEQEPLQGSLHRAEEL